jgi:hypothetical protein
MHAGLVETPERCLEAIARHQLREVTERNADMLQEGAVRAVRVSVDGVLHEPQKGSLALPQAPPYRGSRLL